MLVSELQPPSRFVQTQKQPAFSTIKNRMMLFSMIYDYFCYNVAFDIQLLCNFNLFLFSFDRNNRVHLDVCSLRLLNSLTNTVLLINFNRAFSVIVIKDNFIFLSLLRSAKLFSTFRCDNIKLREGTFVVVSTKASPLC